MWMHASALVHTCELAHMLVHNQVRVELLLENTHMRVCSEVEVEMLF